MTTQNDGSRPSVDTSTPSLGELLGDISRDISTLMRQEVALAKAELSDSAKRAGKAGGMFGGAAMAANLVLVFLSVALWWWLGEAMHLAWAALIVAVLWGVVAAVLVSRGRAEAKNISGAPKTAETVKKIPHALQGHEEENA